MLKLEIIKILKNKTIVNLILVIFLLVILIDLSLINNFKEQGIYFIIIRQLVMASNLFIPIILGFLGLSILAIEYEFKTINSLKINNVNLKRLFLTKLTISILIIFLIYLLMFFLGFIIASIFTEKSKIGLNFNIANVKISFNGIGDILMLYFKQFIGTIFIVSVLYLFMTFKKNSLLTISIMSIIILFTSIIISALVKNNFIEAILPINSEYIWRNYSLEQYECIKYFIYVFWGVINILWSYKNFIRS